MFKRKKGFPNLSLGRIYHSKALPQPPSRDTVPLTAGHRVGENTIPSVVPVGVDENAADESIIQPSTSADRLSVEDMQRSLSREGSPNITPTWVGIHKANFADFILDFRYCYSQSHLHIGFNPSY
jgi:hypothetical protein